MIGKDYFARQAATLLKLARITSSAKTAVAITTKAADLQARAADALPPDTAPGAPSELNAQR